MKAVILRFDAPMISFGSVIVDHHGFTDFFPGVSMLTGMIGNSLGWHHTDFERLQDLQDRIDFAARWDVRPNRVIDYHTVDLGSDKMCKPGWTTRGEIEHRAGGTGAKYGTHQRYRHYLTDGLMTVALGLVGEGYPGLDTIKEAFERPARPLFLGRKTCLPARPFWTLSTRLRKAWISCPYWRSYRCGIETACLTVCQERRGFVGLGPKGSMALGKAGSCMIYGTGAISCLPVADGEKKA